MGTPSLTVTIRNDITELTRLLEEVAVFCAGHQFNDDVLFAINLALDELVSNTINYGFQDGRTDHTINITLTLHDDELHLQVDDDGTAFNPLEQAEPDISAPLDERPIGGLGIFLVKKYMHDLAYTYRDERNILTMQKNLNHTPAFEGDGFEGY